MKIYIFHREKHWYQVELKNDVDAVANAECNPGTIKVTNALTGEVVWPNSNGNEKSKSKQGI